MKKSLKKIISVALTSMVMLTSLAGCSSSKTDSGTSGKPVTITYAIWDKNQEPGMRAIADAFTAKNPNIKVKIEVTNWDQLLYKIRSGCNRWSSSRCVLDAFK